MEFGQNLKDLVQVSKILVEISKVGRNQSTGQNLEDIVRYHKEFAGGQIATTLFEILKIFVDNSKILVDISKVLFQLSEIIVKISKLLIS